VTALATNAKEARSSEYADSLEDGGSAVTSTRPQ